MTDGERLLYRASQLRNEADDLRGRASIEDAVELARQALGLAEEALGLLDPRLVPYLCALALNLSSAAAKPDEIEALLGRAHELSRRPGNPDPLSAGRVLLDLGHFHITHARPAESAAYAESAEEFFSALGELPTDGTKEEALWLQAEAARLSGQAQLDLLEFPEAEASLAKALSFYEKVAGTVHDEVARTLWELARLYRDQTDYTKAELTFKRAHAMLERTIGPWHPELATLSEEIGAFYGLLGNVERAREFVTKAGVVFKQAGGAHSVEYARTLDHLASLFILEERVRDALPLCEKALSIAEAVLSAEHPELALYIERLAQVHRELGNVETAEKLERRAARLTREFPM